MINALRGMKDLIFEDALKYRYITDTASSIAQRYGFEFIETPILEETTLFKRSVGESSDIVGKEMYRFTDKGGNDVCMRPEGTAGVVRAFIQAKLDRQQGFKGKFFYFGPMYRYERPQKGRLRQFHQFGVESFGESKVEEDFTLIQMLSDIFDTLGIEYEVLINSLGCPKCMPPYRDNLLGYIKDRADKLCEDCNRRMDTNPIRVLDCKNEKCQEELKDAPRITHSLCEDCNRDFDRLKELLDKSGISYKVDSNLVRGLDYYTKTAFEFVSQNIGAQSSIAGGGRYDRLVEFLDGKPTPGVGFAIGIERIMELVELPQQERRGIYMGAMIDEAVDTIIDIAHKKRQTDKVSVEYTTKSLKAHLKGADRANARYAVIIGEDEYKNDSVMVRDLQQRSDKTVSIDEFVKMS